MTTFFDQPIKDQDAKYIRDVEAKLRADGIETIEQVWQLPPKSYRKYEDSIFKTLHSLVRELQENDFLMKHVSSLFSNEQEFNKFRITRNKLMANGINTLSKLFSLPESSYVDYELYEEECGEHLKELVTKLQSKFREFYYGLVVHLEQEKSLLFHEMRSSTNLLSLIRAINICSYGSISIEELSAKFTGKILTSENLSKILKKIAIAYKLEIDVYSVGNLTLPPVPLTVKSRNPKSKISLIYSEEINRITFGALLPKGSQTQVTKERNSNVRIGVFGIDSSAGVSRFVSKLCFSENFFPEHRCGARTRWPVLVTNTGITNYTIKINRVSIDEIHEFLQNLAHLDFVNGIEKEFFNRFKDEEGNFDNTKDMRKDIEIMMIQRFKEFDCDWETREFSDVSVFKDYLKRLTRIPDGSSDKHGHLFPFIDSIEINGNFPAIPPNVTIVDLPTYNFCHKFMTDRMFKYMKSCSHFFMMMDRVFNNFDYTGFRSKFRNEFFINRKFDYVRDITFLQAKISDYDEIRLCWKENLGYKDVLKIMDKFRNDLEYFASTDLAEISSKRFKVDYEGKDHENITMMAAPDDYYPPSIISFDMDKVIQYLYARF